MTYYETYSACRTAVEIKEKAIYDKKLAIFMRSNPDIIKVIEDAMNKAIADKGEVRNKYGSYLW